MSQGNIRHQGRIVTQNSDLLKLLRDKTEETFKPPEKPLSNVNNNKKSYKNTTKVRQKLEADTFKPVLKSKGSKVYSVVNPALLRAVGIKPTAEQESNFDNYSPRKNPVYQQNTAPLKLDSNNNSETDITYSNYLTDPPDPGQYPNIYLTEPREPGQYPSYSDTQLDNRGLIAESDTQISQDVKRQYHSLSLDCEVPLSPIDRASRNRELEVDEDRGLQNNRNLDNHSLRNKPRENPKVKQQTSDHNMTGRNSSVQRVYIESPTFTKAEEEEYRFVSSRLEDYSENQETFRNIPEPPESISPMKAKSNRRVHYEDFPQNDDSGRYIDVDESEDTPSSRSNNSRQFVLRSTEPSRSAQNQSSLMTVAPKQLPQKAPGLGHRLPTGPTYDPDDEEELERETNYQVSLITRVGENTKKVSDLKVPKLPLPPDSDDDIPRDSLDYEEEDTPTGFVKDSLDLYSPGQKAAQGNYDYHQQDEEYTPRGQQFTISPNKHVGTMHQRRHYQNASPVKSKAANPYQQQSSQPQQNSQPHYVPYNDQEEVYEEEYGDYNAYSHQAPAYHQQYQHGPSRTAQRQDAPQSRFNNQQGPFRNAADPQRQDGPQPRFDNQHGSFRNAADPQRQDNPQSRFSNHHGPSRNPADPAQRQYAPQTRYPNPDIPPNEESYYAQGDTYIPPLALNQLEPESDDFRYQQNQKNTVQESPQHHQKHSDRIQDPYAHGHQMSHHAPNHQIYQQVHQASQHGVQSYHPQYQTHYPEQPFEIQESQNDAYHHPDNYQGAPADVDNRKMGRQIYQQSHQASSYGVQSFHPEYQTHYHEQPFEMQESLNDVANYPHHHPDDYTDEGTPGRADDAKPKFDFIQNNRKDYGKLHKKSYQQIQAVKKEEGAKLESRFIKPKVKSKKKLPNSAPVSNLKTDDRYSSSPQLNQKPSTAEELWAKKATHLSHNKKGTKNAGKLKKYPSDGEFPLVKPRTQNQGYANRSLPPAGFTNPPPQRPLALAPISRELITDDGQRISVDVNLKLLSSPPQSGGSGWLAGPSGSGGLGGPAGLDDYRYTASDYLLAQAAQLSSRQHQDYSNHQHSQQYYPDRDDYPSTREYDSAPEYLDYSQPLNLPPGRPISSSYKVIPPIPSSTESSPTKSIDPNDSYVVLYRKQKEKQNEEPNYKIYNLKDYRMMQKEVRLAGLGPDLDNNTHKEKIEKYQLKTDYARMVNERNKKQLVNSRRPPSYPRQQESSEDIMNKRRLAVEYAKTIPKPAVKPSPNIYNSYEVSGQIPLGSNLIESPKSKPNKIDMIDLDNLRLRHERDKQNVAVIQQNMESQKA